MKTLRPTLSATIGLALLVGLAACRERSFELTDLDAAARAERRAFDSGTGDGQGGGSGGGAGGGGMGGSGGGGGSGTDGGGGEVAGVPEQCNGLDDDGDGTVDEDFDLTSDRSNCGTCGHHCQYTNAVGNCVASACQKGDCFAGFFDADGNPDNGCECVKSNGGIEICDSLDNDCDGKTDEDFDLANSLAHCGGCGKVCARVNAKAVCDKGTCSISECLPNFYDRDKKDDNGCEDACIKSGVEVCDGFDNDCNGLTDDGSVAGVGEPCGPPQAGVGTCTPGTKICSKGVYLCMGAVFPSVELCDLADNDCDGKTDNGFDKMNDPFHCGGCSACPSKPNVAVPGCSGGACYIAACASGWYDTNGSFADGCETNCLAGGPEICDGVDNDCDGKTDNGDDSLVYPSNFCIQMGECAKGPGGSSHYSEMTFPVCKSLSSEPPDWHCNYPATVETVAPDMIAPDETSCDDKDNDCDGQTDDPFPEWGQPCYDNGIGVCRREGTYKCTTDGSALECTYSGPAPSAGSEVCNGLDDNCNGSTDEIVTGNGFDDSFVMVGGVAMFAHEASRPDATAAVPGTATAPRPCSLASKQPWTDVTKEEADTACAAVGSGWRLCSGTEWQDACNGSGNTTFPYGATYVGTTCNGNDYPGTGAIATGVASSCKSDNGGGNVLYDMSGNVREWVKTGSSYYLRGGAYNTLSFSIGGAAATAPGLQCDASIAAPATATRLPSVGFRCCHSGTFP